jgi:hypothetical protein
VKVTELIYKVIILIEGVGTDIQCNTLIEGDGTVIQSNTFNRIVKIFKVLILQLADFVTWTEKNVYRILAKKLFEGGHFEDRHRDMNILKWMFQKSVVRM